MPQEQFRAVMFDLLTALLNSWSFWNGVAGTESAGLRWRKLYLELTYQAGSYRSYEGIITEAANEVGLTSGHADEFVRRWGDLEPWPETHEVLHAIAEKVPVAVATNASRTLADVAVANLGASIPIVVTAEETGNSHPTVSCWSDYPAAPLPSCLSPGLPLTCPGRLPCRCLSSGTTACVSRFVTLTCNRNLSRTLCGPFWS